MPRFDLGVMLVTASWLNISHPVHAQLWEEDCERVEAHGGVAACDDITVEGDINLGVSSEELLKAVEAFARKDSLNAQRAGALQNQVDQLSAEIGVRKSAIENFLHILDQQNVPLEKLGANLEEIANRHKNFIAQARAGNSSDPEAQQLYDRMTNAFEAGDYNRADILLNKVEARSPHGLGKALALDKRGELERTRLNYKKSAEHFADAASSVPVANHGARQKYLTKQASMLYSYGDEFGHNSALTEAISVYRDLLEEIFRERTPLDWAEKQQSLGTALSLLGYRENNTDRLEEALNAFHLALEERPRERVPFDWAQTQHSLGSVLRYLGERESGIIRLEESVHRIRLALQETTRERRPFDWAIGQNSIGNALSIIGERESSTARLEEAVVAYRLALEEQTRERVPIEWGRTQNGLGSALFLLGERESGTARLEEALYTYRLALEERTRERVPLHWATTQSNIGYTLLRLGQRETGTVRLEEAIYALRLSLEEKSA